ncbi:MAG: hypothetical protein ACREX9_10090 [Gammaproteobacteria bacterium]
MATLILTGSVGSGIAKSGTPHNQPSDVAKVRDRLVQLGYEWVSGFTLGIEAEFIGTIKLFQSICKGSPKANNGDGRIDLHGNTHRWLAAGNAPGWVKIHMQSGIGWKSTHDLEFKERMNSHTTTWMEERIRSAGLEYSVSALLIPNAPPMWIRDCSPAKGGDALGHKSHQTGLDVDMRLPLLPPKTNDWDRLGPSTYTELFYLEAALAQLRAIKARMDAEYVWFNDPRCIKEKLCKEYPNHGNHYHIRIRPPAREEGTYK